MEKAGSIDYGLKLAREKVDLAISKIQFLPETEEKEFMIALANYAIDREV